MPKPKSRLAVLKAARELIVNKENWIKGDFAESEYIDGGAGKYRMKYCAVGAIRHVDGPAEEAAKTELAKTILAEYPKMGSVGPYGDAEDAIINYNDRKKTSHKKLISMFDKTIERLSR